MTTHTLLSSSFNKEIYPSSPPINKDEVVITLLGNDFIADSVIDLGAHKLGNNVVSYSITAIPYDNITTKTLIKDGFQTLEFDEGMMTKLKPIYELTNSLTVKTPENEDIPYQKEQKQKTINFIQDWVKQTYSNIMGINEKDIDVLCSRNLIMRIAGCDKSSCHIPGNPLFHLDYIDFKKTYDRQCLEQEKYVNPVNCPPFENLIDVINIWFPTKPIDDWPLGFINNDNIQIRDYVPVQIVSGSQAASMRYKEGLNVCYKKNMKPPEVYMFRSATENVDKKGTFHGSFRITDKKLLRYSVEIRCCIFKKGVKSPSLQSSKLQYSKLQSSTLISSGGRTRKIYKYKKKPNRKTMKYIKQ